MNPMSSPLEQTPRKLGFRMPAEWELHEATWISWPTDLDTWPDDLPKLEATYLEIVKHLYEGEKINVLVQREDRERISKKIAEHGIKKNVFFHTVPTNSPWIRDYGPTFVTQKTDHLALIHWEFNAWGGKYPFHLDQNVPDEISRILRVKEFRSDVIMEGGAVEINGSGTCLVTEECLLNPNRNPTLDKSAIEQALSEFLNLKQIIWLGKGIAGDDTDGHVDELARFVLPDTIVAAVEDDKNDENFTALKENWERLKNAAGLDGKPFKIVALPMPEKIEFKGNRFPASYCNFYIGNEAVLVPTFRQKTDSKALGILKEFFPDREVAGLDAIPLVYGQGAFHCVTQQQPLANI